MKTNKISYMTEGMMHRYARPNLIQTTVLTLILSGSVTAGLLAEEAIGTQTGKTESLPQEQKNAESLMPPAEPLEPSVLEDTGKEILSREVDERLADSYAKDAAQAYQKGEYAEAVEKYLQAIKALESLGELPRLKDKAAKCKVAISKAYYYWSQKIYFEAEDTAKAGEFESAIQKCKKAMEIYPPSKDLMEEAIAKYSKMKNAAEYRTQVSEAAIDPQKKERLYNVEVLLRQGENFYQKKQWDKAKDKFEEVLSINPYNGRAIENLRKTYVRLAEAGARRKDLTHIERLTEVAWKPVPPIIIPTDAGDLETPELILKNELDNQIQKKLKDLVLEHIEFEEVSIPVVANYLKRESKRVDPDKIGVNIVLRLPQLKAKDPNTAATTTAAPSLDEDVLSEDEISEESGEDGATPAASNETPTVTMVVDDITLEEAIKYICKSANLKYRVEKYAVVIASQDVALDEVETRIYPIEREALDLISSDIDSDDKMNEAVKKYFENRAIEFPAGAKIVYDRHISRLIVTNTPEMLNQVEGIIKEMNVVDPQVLIQVKFVEISLNDLEELGFEYVISRVSPYRDPIPLTPLTPNWVGHQSINPDGTLGPIVYTNDPQVASQGMNIVTQQYKSQTVNGVQIFSKDPDYTVITKDPLNAGDSFVIPSQNIGTTNPVTYYGTELTPNYGKSTTFGPNDSLVRNAKDDPLAFGQQTAANDTVFDWSAYNKNGYKSNVKIHAVDQADSSDILSAPRLTTMNGQEAVIRMVTEKYYPESWGDSELGQMNSNNQTVPIFTPSIPEFGEATEEGIILRVLPTVDPDKYTISLQMNPVIQHMIGWTDYSYEMPLGNNGELYPNVLKMPVIEARTLNTNVSVYDGETVVLGGIIKDTISEVDDSYPFLGDIPLVGRLFQSRGKSSQKVNLLIFLTCKLVNPDGSPLREREERSLPPFRR